MKTHEMPPPDTLCRQLDMYLDTLLARGFSPRAVADNRSQLQPFVTWCEQRGVGHAPQVNLLLLESWQRTLRAHRKADGQPYSASARRKRLGTLRRWFAWLLSRHHILYNPAEELVLPRAERRLPVQGLNEHETTQVMASLDARTPTDFRNRVMLEVLWSTGIRRGELRNLRTGDIDPHRGTLMVRQGKGQKDRVVPIGERALAWLSRYQGEVRPWLLGRHDSEYLFVTQRGQPLCLGMITQIAGQAIRERARLDKPGACHVFRHTMATQMLDNGADIRHIQAMLGHEKLDTTQIYTQVAIGQLKKVHQQTHPAERDNPALPKTDNPAETPESLSDRGDAESTAPDRQPRRG
ncbi:site-specific tyrosine recombinase XerC [Xenorhabdus cabanillasii]|uniref:Tyrosine recombinase xerC 2 n=1 Tax=Xenorhabdus cabanillasii JM26 TaxID=1427517 RepID=W1JAD0_9GAMM|nr:site-specific tyrosine recombinase XerC [Xenorhabdus cabanillasii]PHM75353.1 integrase/recombinase [Xenorhabdus cabanillasii JM26]CDL86430.1 Tyrosine recombinase xerC 2 [Xenorhabdus cabanillasii JM26]